jgi:hypothetical protein
MEKKKNIENFVLKKSKYVFLWKNALIAQNIMMLHLSLIIYMLCIDDHFHNYYFEC